jgi:hypothetical protein
MDFESIDAAVAAAEKLLKSETRTLATESGAAEVHTKFVRQDNVAHIGGREMFIESVLEATAFGRPRITR